MVSGTYFDRSTPEGLLTAQPRHFAYVAAIGRIAPLRPLPRNQSQGFSGVKADLPFARLVCKAISFGCGTGQYSAALAAHFGAHVVAVDPSDRIPAGEIEQLVAGRVRQWLLDPGSIYQAISAWIPEPSTQQQLVARAVEIGRQWSELPPARRRAVLIALIERVDVGVDQIDIRLRPPRLGALLDVAQGDRESKKDTGSVYVRSLKNALRNRSSRLHRDGKPDEVPTGSCVLRTQSLRHLLTARESTHKS